ncbi:MAG: phosphoglycerate kinase [Crocinitomicaceae bacterium]|nr:phosphoglycerate kinase [Crocinitomicaceae bacterium]|tara:strand:+ start:784 stop:1977 length:1194 start_codon:yes stop_codon:yes gene_type:complete
MKTIKDFDINGKRVLVRVDFNVPLNDNLEITDDTRIQAALPTINHILDHGGSVILMSHLGRPKSGPEKRFSLSHLKHHLSLCLGRDVLFADDCIGDSVYQMSSKLRPGDVLLIENLRFHSAEKSGDKSFAEMLSHLGDFYVNDAFGTAHRAHASTAVIADYFPGKCAYGLLMAKELENIKTVLEDTKKPFTAVIGGAKVSSKISIIENLLPKIDSMIIGGGMSYTFIKAMGGKVGSSLVEDDYLQTANKVLEKAEELGVRIFLPEDSVIASSFDNNADRKSALSDEIPESWMGLDIGPEAIARYSTCLRESRTILWNGPMGVFEMENFETGTHEIANAIVEATERGAYSLIGGGDSVAAVNKYNLKDHVSYVSTGGGAMLEYIEGKTLPGVAAVQNK